MKKTFSDSHLISGTPKKLLVVATGNITNNEFLALFEGYLEVVVESLGRADYVELRRDVVVVHERRDD